VGLVIIKEAGVIFSEHPHVVHGDSTKRSWARVSFFFGEKVTSDSEGLTIGGKIDTGCDFGAVIDTVSLGDG
jgi:hypothetical protein